MLLHTAFAAGYSVKAVQDSLKKQGFYFGETTGKLDEPTRAAIKRFQIRQGMTVTGEADAATLEALQRGPATASATSAGSAAAPEVSVRERAQNLVQTDREFLEKVEAIDLNAPASPESPSTAAPASTSKPAGESSSSRRTSAPAAQPQALAEEPETEAPPVERERDATRRDAAPPKRERPEPTAARAESDAPPAASAISESEARRFVESYLAAAEAPSPEREVSFYADQVDYFDSGKVNRSFIRKDQNSYYRRWPQRDFDLVSPPQVDRASGNAASLRFRVRYALRGPSETASGQVENYVRVRKENSGLKIVAIRERKLR